MGATGCEGGIGIRCRKFDFGSGGAGGNVLACSGARDEGGSRLLPVYNRADKHCVGERSLRESIF